MGTTTRCARASSVPSNASCSPAAASTPRLRHAWPYSTTSNFYNPRRRHSALDYQSPIEAAAIQVEFEEACGTRSVDEIAISPLQRFGIGGTTIDGGVVGYLSTIAGPADQLMADMRCHRAWMMLAPPTGMDDCPLDLPDLRVGAHGNVDGITITIIETRPALVGELQRRSAHELETAVHQPAHR